MSVLKVSRKPTQASAITAQFVAASSAGGSAATLSVTLKEAMT